MKSVTLTATVVALATSFAVPSFAMENPVEESRAKIESVLALQKASRAGGASSAVRATTFSVKQPDRDNSYGAIVERLFGNRSEPSGR